MYKINIIWFALEILYASRSCTSLAILLQQVINTKDLKWKSLQEQEPKSLLKNSILITWRIKNLRDALLDLKILSKLREVSSKRRKMLYLVLNFLKKKICFLKILKYFYFYQDWRWWRRRTWGRAYVRDWTGQQR